MHPLIKDLCGTDPERVAAALQAASSMRDELLPEIIIELIRLAEDPESWEEDSDSPIFLYYLGAEWRDSRVYDLLIRALSLPAERIREVLDDFLSSGAPRVLADTWSGDLAKLEALAMVPGADSFARGAALSAVTMLMDRQLIPQAKGYAFFERVTTDLDPKDDGDVEFASLLVSNLLDMRAVEMRGLIEKLYDQKLADPGWSGSKEEVVALLLDPTSPIQAISQPIASAWEAVRQWSFFSPEEAHKRWGSDKVLEGVIERPVRDPILPNPPFLAPPVPGRNDPCSCGSGKKYKKCCG